MTLIKRKNIILYVGGGAILLISLYLLILKPLSLKHLNIQDKIEKKELLLNRYKTIIEREDQLKERVAYIKKEFDKLDRALLSKTKPALAASELQAIIENISQRVHVNIKNIRNKKPLEKGVFYQIPIEITIESTLRELEEIIYHLEISDKFLFVRGLSVRLIKSGNPEKLESKIIIDGFIKKVINSQTNGT